MEISQDRSIELTNTATDKIMSVLKEGNCTKFRVYVTGGGCSGFNYGFKLDEKTIDGDFSIEKRCDSFSRSYELSILRRNYN